MRLNNAISLFNQASAIKNSLLLTKNFDDYFKVLNKTKVLDIQEDSYRIDFKSLEELNSLLNTILAITRRHYRSFKNNEIISRSELIANFDNESFIKTTKEMSFWRKKDFSVKPLYAYSYEMIDDLNTYENRLVISALKRLELIAKNYDYYYAHQVLILENNLRKNDFSYASFLYHDNRALNANLLSKENTQTKEIDEYILKLKDKIKKIQNTPFYLALKGVPLVKDKITLTNIFKENRLYNQVYRFYYQTHQYLNQTLGDEALLNYSYFLIIKTLIKEGYRINQEDLKFAFLNEKAIVLTSIIRFLGKEFNLELSYLDKEKAFLIKVINAWRKQDQSLNLIYLRYHFLEEEINLTPLDSDKYNNIYLYRFDQLAIYQNHQWVKAKFSFQQSEQEMIEVILKSLTKIISGKAEIYQAICPYCGSRYLVSENKNYLCLSCHKHYALIKKDQIWIKDNL